MRMRYLGKTDQSKIDNCEALYATDRGTFVVQSEIHRCGRSRRAA